MTTSALGQQIIKTIHAPSEVEELYIRHLAIFVRVIFIVSIKLINIFTVSQNNYCSLCL